MNNVLSNALPEKINLWLFGLINAPANPSGTVVNIALFCAEYLIFIAPVMILICWFLGQEDRKKSALNAILVMCAALLINVLIGALWFHPRPFMVPVGHNFLAHIADASFPSDHMTVMSAIACALLIKSSTKLEGLIIAICAVAVAWGRVYLGVHFPFDMLGSIVVSLFVAILFNRHQTLTNGLYPYVITIHKRLFKKAAIEES